MDIPKDKKYIKPSSSTNSPINRESKMRQTIQNAQKTSYQPPDQFSKKSSVPVLSGNRQFNLINKFEKEEKNLQNQENFTEGSDINQSISTNCEFDTVSNIKSKISDKEKNMKVTKKNRDLRPNVGFDSNIIHKNNDVENLKINYINKVEMIGGKNKNFQNSNESYKEPYIEENENAVGYLIDKKQENQDYNEIEEEKGHEDVKNKEGSQIYNYDDVEESIDIFSINTANKDLNKVIIEKKLKHYKEREYYLEKIISQRASECAKQLGHSNYNLIITFFRAKLRVCNLNR